MSTIVEPITTVEGTGVPVRGNDIDTDRIIPARFMKEVTFENLGQYAFYDARRDDDGELNEHPFNRYPEANILIVNKNFGCGSSREHAPQALMRWGVEGIIGESFAEIFAGNCLVLGIPTVTADHDTVEQLMDLVEDNPATRITIDLENEKVTAGNTSVEVHLGPSQKEALIQGIWDTTALMRMAADDVRSVYNRLPYTAGFRREKV